LIHHSETSKRHNRRGGPGKDGSESPGFRAANADFFGTGVLFSLHLPQERCNCRDSGSKKAIPVEIISGKVCKIEQTEALAGATLSRFLDARLTGRFPA